MIDAGSCAPGCEPAQWCEQCGYTPCMCDEERCCECGDYACAVHLT